MLRKKAGGRWVVTTTAMATAATIDGDEDGGVVAPMVPRLAESVFMCWGCGARVVAQVVVRRAKGVFRGWPSLRCRVVSGHARYRDVLPRPSKDSYDRPPLPPFTYKSRENISLATDVAGGAHGPGSRRA